MTELSNHDLITEQASISTDCENFAFALMGYFDYEEQYWEYKRELGPKDQYYIRRIDSMVNQLNIYEPAVDPDPASMSLTAYFHSSDSLKPYSTHTDLPHFSHFGVAVPVDDSIAYICKQGIGGPLHISMEPFDEPEIYGDSIMYFIERK